MAKVGAKCKLTEEMIEQLCTLKGAGLSNKAVCDGAGISDRSLYDWLGHGEDDARAGNKTVFSVFLRAYQKAITTHKLKRIQQIQAAAAAGNWQAAAWELERCYPNDYGRRINATVSGAVPVVIAGGGDVAE